MDTEQYEQKLRRSTVVSRLIIGAGALVVVALIVGLRSFRAWTRMEAEERPSPGVVVRVAADGTMVVDGCSSGLGPCLSAASIREGHRSGGGHLECLVVPATGTPESASQAAYRACLAAGFSPSLLPPGAKY